MIHAHFISSGETLTLESIGVIGHDFRLSDSTVQPRLLE